MTNRNDSRNDKNQQPDITRPVRRPNDPDQTLHSPRRQPAPPQATIPARRLTRSDRLRRIFLSVAIGMLITIVLFLSGSVLIYSWIAYQLPPAEELRSRSFQFATTQILDRDGNVLYEIIDPSGGRRTNVLINDIDPKLIQATVATEDRFFYVNVGVDPIAVARALYYNLSEGELVSGASTITQQLARNVLLSTEERTQQTYIRKIREAVLAVEINRRYTKDEILEVYLNQIYYGNLAYGIEAAARTYFGKSSRNLTLAEAAMLAGLPQSPALHNPYNNPEQAKSRQAVVLGLMVEAGYITQGEANAAKNEPLQFRELGGAFDAPHFVNYVRQELEKIIPAAYIYEAGLTVKTTLDPRLQDIAEQAIQGRVAALTNRNVTNGALVALDASTGHILAMVGSADFRSEEIGGQINMATAPRQPGSTIKPLTYLATFERLNWTPSTMLLDIPVEYSDGRGGIYRPRNYDDEFRGPVSIRAALANSYNIPAVRALEDIGVSALQEISQRMGITTLTGNNYGLPLTLGSGEVPLIEMTGAYQALANAGILIPPTAIIEIRDSFGRTIQPPRAQARQVLRTEHAYLMTHILADNDAREDSTGLNSPQNLTRPAASKTGTTNDFRDSWTIGYTPDLVAGVWLGNADRSPMSEVSGSVGAGVTWNIFMEQAHQNLPARNFDRPDSIITLEVCAKSGTIPSDACPERRPEVFFRDQPPLGPEHDLYQCFDIDRNTGFRANEFCQGSIEKRCYEAYPPEARNWAISEGIVQPPEDFCPANNIIAAITNPSEGSFVQGVIAVEGSALAANFSRYQLELGVGTNPTDFAIIHGPLGQLVERGTLAVFDTAQLPNGPYVIRLVVLDRTDGTNEARVRVHVSNPQSTNPTNTPLPVAPELLIPGLSTPAPPQAPTPATEGIDEVPPLLGPTPTSTPAG